MALKRPALFSNIIRLCRPVRERKERQPIGRRTYRPLEVTSPTVQYVSECFIKPLHQSEESKKPVYLSSWDLGMLSIHYIQKGLVFTKPSSFELEPFLQKLKESLSLTLVHFYPLAGRLSTLKQENPHLYSVFIDCVNSPGARFVHASLDQTISDILSPKDVPLVVRSFFDHNKALNHDGHELSLLTIQVTELTDGVFIGCSINHVVADGSSFWHFFNTFSEIFKAKNEENQDIVKISRSPIHNRWFPEGRGPIISLPYTHHDQFLSRYEAPQMRETFFLFSKASLKKLKEKANQECNTTNISSLQALSAHMWRCITRVINLPSNQVTMYVMAINNRSRLDPPLPNEYFGNCIQNVIGTATASELLENGLGWAAWKMHEAVMNHKNKEILEWVETLESGLVLKLGGSVDTRGSVGTPCIVAMGSSPRFDVYGNEFGLGKAVALRNGYENKFDGKIASYPGIEGDGSIDLEVTLSPAIMAALESDKEFLYSLSS